MAQNNIINDLQSSSSESLIELFELDLGSGIVLYFHPGTDQNYSNIIFDGKSYTPLPIQVEGIDILSDGANSRPTLSIANVTNIFKTTLNDNNFRMDDLIGTKITRRRTFEKYLGNPAEIFEFPLATYLIDRISAENSIVVEFELASPFDVEGVKLPSRIIVGKYCSWIYQGRNVKNCGGCSWLADSSFYIDEDNTNVYTAFFDTEDRPLIPAEINPIPAPNPPPSNWNYILPLEGSWPAWSSGTYNIDALVQHNGKYWRSDFEGNTQEPGTGSWTEIRLYLDWEPQGYSANSLVKYRSLTEKVFPGQLVVGRTYRISFLGNTDFTALGASSNTLYTEFTATSTGTEGETGIVDDMQTGVVAIWRTSLGHATAQEPSFGSPYWIRADSCSKTLKGCKVRFQFRPIPNTSIPSAFNNTLKNLPFGAFPGSVKFK